VTLAVIVLSVHHDAPHIDLIVSRIFIPLKILFEFSALTGPAKELAVDPAGWSTSFCWF
jgi:hypothetical protein